MIETGMVCFVKQSGKLVMYYLAKKLFFLFLRMKSEVSLFEGYRENSDEYIKLCYIGSVLRGKEFVCQIFGNLPDRRVVGNCLSIYAQKRLEKYYTTFDVVMVETNRLLLTKFLKNGFFPIPEWIEFERPVIIDEKLRYSGGTKSLKSDLNRIKKTRYHVSVSNSLSDFDKFYETMYLPFVEHRYGENGILKSRTRLKRDFLSGFLMFVCDAEKPIAGAIVLPDKYVVRETTIGIAYRSGSALRTGVTGILDYHIHDWAAKHGKRVMNVGHTRAFPNDGVFFNKRKWLMRVVPDQDGVNNISVKFNGTAWKASSLIHPFPFIFQTKTGLILLCSLDQEVAATANQLKSLHQRYWTDGLQSMVVFSPAGFSPHAVEYRNESLGFAVQLISDLNPFWV